jgi:protein-serine/threonine kinase
MQASPQPPTSSSPYTTAANRYQSQPSPNHYAYESNQDVDPSQQTRQSRRPNGYQDSGGYDPSEQAYYAPYSSSPSNALQADLPDRSRSFQHDQYDGAPVPPPRTSSQQPSPSVVIPPSTAPLDQRVESSRYARQAATNAQTYSSPNQNYGGDYNEPVREGSRDATATSAPDSARSRRKEDGQYGATSTHEQAQQSAPAAQSRSEANMQNSRPVPTRENSEVLNRVIVSDPTEDAESLQVRVAEAQPAPLNNDITPVTGLGLVGSEGVDDGGRGGQKRQDFSKSSSRRKDVQFGDYMLGQTLGEGEFGKVKLGWKKDGSSQVAIKLIRRETVATNPTRLPKIYREISILRELQHPNIVRLHEMVETERHIGIILEYASGGELFDYILTHRYLKDQAARRLFAQLVSGVGYLHKKGIVHRDLKLENLLLDQNRNIIITDFGFANTFNPGEELGAEIEYNLSNRDFVRKYRLDRQDEQGRRRGDLMQTSCGSPCYAAPELVVSDSLYTGRKVDVWSCGVILVSSNQIC